MVEEGGVNHNACMIKSYLRMYVFIDDDRPLSFLFQHAGYRFGSCLRNLYRTFKMFCEVFKVLSEKKKRNYRFGCRERDKKFNEPLGKRWRGKLWHGADIRCV